jgi:hypothetical protein
MIESNFRDLERLYERAGKPRWPWWWYGGLFLICLAALILILCSGPGKARAEDPAAPAAASAEVCSAMRAEVLQLLSVSMQLGYARMQEALNERGMLPAEIHATVDASNKAAAKNGAWALWGAQIAAHAQAILLAFGCKEE